MGETGFSPHIISQSAATHVRGHPEIKRDFNLSETF